MDLLCSNPSILSPKQSKAQEVFDSADSLDEKLKAFEDLEVCCKEKDLGLTCFTLALAIYQEGDDLEKVLLFSLRALNIITENGSSTPLAVPRILQLLGIVSYDLRRLDESLLYFNGAVEILEKLDRDSSYCDLTVLEFLNKVEFQLYNVKFTMGKIDESMSHVRKMLEIVEKMSGKDSMDFAKSSRDVCDIYLKNANFGEALHCCFSAMEVYQKVYGDDSWEVAECRKQLGIIYCGLGKHVKGLEQNLLSQTLLKNLDCAPLLLRAEIEAAHMLNHLGKNKEAVENLRVIVPKTEKLSQNRIMALTYVAEFLCCQGKLAEAKRSARKVFEILDKNEENIPSSLVAVGFMKIANVYAEMKDYETALICLRRVPPILEQRIPNMRFHSYLRDLPLRYASLLMLTGEIEKSIPFIEEGINTMKHVFGSKHANVGRAYGTLGSVYHILGSSCSDANKVQLSVKFLTYAKEILDKSLGPLHKESIMACKSLCRTYIAMGSYSDAMEILDETILRIEAFGLSSPDELAEVDSMMDTLKIMKTNDVSESHLKESVLLLNDEDYSAKDSQSVIANAHTYSGAVNLEENLVGCLKQQGPPNAQEKLSDPAKLMEKLMNEAYLSRG